MKGMTYAGTGVDYDSMDPFKRQAQLAAKETSRHLDRFGFKEFETSRGESAYLVETPSGFMAHVEEGLGTKNLIADAVYKLTGKSYYDHIAQCTVAMIVNDMITVGALPVSVAMHLAVGSSDWFKDEKRANDLIRGWKGACDLAFCTWGGGETPTLKDVVIPGTVVLSGSGMGIIQDKENRIEQGTIEAGDQIVILESSGIHANGLTLARKIAEKIPEGYAAKLSDGRGYGESLLDPTIIYVEFIESCLVYSVDLHYAVNITGHGWRKLMRAQGNFEYIIEKIPEPQPVFKFIQEHGPVEDQEAYGNFNMGAGFAVYVSASDLEKALGIAERCGLKAHHAGHIKAADRKVVRIVPKGLVYEGETLNIR